MAKEQAEPKGSTATLPAEGSGESADQFEQAGPDESKHNAIADVMAGAGLEVETPATPSKAEPSEEPKAKATTKKRELGPNVQDGKVIDEEPATKKEPAAKVEDTEPALNKHQLSTAKQMGYSEEEIAEMDTEVWSDILDRNGRKLHTKLSELGRLEKKLRTGKAPDTEEEPKAHAKTDKAEKSEEDLDYTYDREDWRDDQDIPKQNRHLAATKANSAALDNMRSQLDDLLAERRGAEADRYFEGLSKDAFPMFGEGRFTDLAPDGPQANARAEVMEEASNLRAYWKSQGKPMSLSDAVERAVYHLHPEAVKNAERKTIAGDVAKQRKRSNAKPSHRRTIPLPSTDEGSKHAKIAEKAAELGITLEVSK